MADQTSPEVMPPVPDMGFASTRYGLLRISQAIIGFLALIMVESTGPCWGYSYHNYNFFASVASFAMIFAIIVMIFFCFRVQDVIERYINFPLTLCVTETVCCVLFGVASLLLLVSYCPRSGLNFLSKICSILGILGSFAFGYAAQISYTWFREGTLPDNVY